MPIVIRCTCGKTLRARDEQAGRQCKCPACGRRINVPYPVATIVPPGSEPPPAPQPTQTQPIHADPDDPQIDWQPMPQCDPGPPASATQQPQTQSDNRELTWRAHVYWLLLLTVIPLLYTTFAAKPDIEALVNKTLDEHPDLRPQYEEILEESDFGFPGEPTDGPTTREATVDDLEQLLPLIPGRKLHGALLARDSWGHWIFALAATALFFPFVLFAIPADYVSGAKLFLSGLFTATLGVALLLIVQSCGSLFCCIGLWYVAALHPDAPFGPSLLGFVLGIGVCEETIKCIPVLWRMHRDDDFGWREACLIGMASGAGFGVSEGIHYCSQYYNGILPLDIYLTRFLSTAALHILLSGACGILIFRKRQHLEEFKDPFDWLLTIVAIMIVPIFLHGLFNTLLKKELDALALAVWLMSFAWLAWLITSSRKKEWIAYVAMTSGPRVERTEKGTRFVST